MPEPRHREEVLNVVLAQLLDERGIVSAPEQVLRSAQSTRAMPDVLVTYRGLTTAIEGKVDDTADAVATVEHDATRRLEQGISHLSVAVLYPAALRTKPFPDLPLAMADARLFMAVFTEAGSDGWVPGDVGQLVELLHRSYQNLVEDDVLQRAIDVLSEAVESFANAVLATQGNVERTANALGIAAVENDSSAADDETDD